MCIYTHIIEVNDVINRIHEKAFRSDLSTQIKKILLFLELLTKNYFFLLFICTWQLCYIFSKIFLISHIVFPLCAIF